MPSVARAAVSDVGRCGVVHLPSLYLLRTQLPTSITLTLSPPHVSGVKVVMVIKECALLILQIDTVLPFHLCQEPFYCRCYPGPAVLGSAVLFSGIGEEYANQTKKRSSSLEYDHVANQTSDSQIEGNQKV